MRTLDFNDGIFFCSDAGSSAKNKKDKRKNIVSKKVTSSIEILF